MTTAPKSASARTVAGANSPTPAPRLVVLSGDQLEQLRIALEEAFTLDGLRQLLRTGLDGNLSVTLDSVVAVQDRTLKNICDDLVLWALRDERVGLYGLLAAAFGSNPDNPRLAQLHQEWAGIVFTPPQCPYPGMKPFTTDQRAQFFGRAAEIALAVDRMRRHPFLAVIGPSGSGKSSLLAAGILPALESSHYFADKRWVVRTLRPGATPYDKLASAFSLPSGVPDAGSDPLRALRQGCACCLS